MLFKNHTKVNLVDDPFYQSKKAEFEGLLLGKNTITFKTRDKIVFDEKTGFRIPDRQQSIPVMSIIQSTDGMTEDTWIYTERSPKVNQKGEYEYDLAPIIISREVTVPTTMKDKIFFLLYLSTAAKSKRIIVVDEVAETVSRVENIKKKAEVPFLLTNEKYSPLTEERIRLIAKAFEVNDVDKKQRAVVVSELLSIIDLADKTGDASKDTSAFLDAIGDDEITDVKAIVQEAIEQGKVRYDDKQLFYFYADESGGYAKKIVSVDTISAASETKKRSILNNYFISNASKKGELQSLLGYETVDIDFDSLAYPSLKKWLAAHGQHGGGSGDEVKERAKEYYYANKDTKKFDMTLLKIKEPIPPAS